ncbi:MAG: GatB/YqeY domain-containing protein, partial [Actinomycetota bacterium]|nr:GatB/YqeY domain-containing protein [Actinomycetota bacterium]
FADAGRTDRADRELAEAEVLQSYLPAQLTDDELVELVRAAVRESGAAEPRQMGQVMKLLQPRVAGRAEGSRVAGEVKRQLSAG